MTAVFKCAAPSAGCLGGLQKPTLAQKGAKSAKLSKGTLTPIDISGGVDSAVKAEVKRQYQENGLVVLKMLDQVGSHM